MRFVRSGPVRLHYEEAGQGPPIVFAHELASDLRQWAGQISRLQHRFRCIAWNARGYPPSDIPEEAAAYDWTCFVDDIGAVFDGLGLGKAWLVGWSMGAYAALHFALRRPERLKGVIAVGVGSGSPPGETEAFRDEMAELAKLYQETGSQAAAERIASGANRLPLRRNNPKAWRGFVRDLKARPATAMARVCANYQGKRPSLLDFTEDFSRMRVPTLLLVGEEDGACLETTRTLARAIPGAELRTFAGVGHAPNLETPDAFHKTVLGFIDGTGPNRP